VSFSLCIRHLNRTDLPESATELARFLIGKVLVHDLPSGRMSGRIVETEAYLPNDASCHAFRGPTPRNRSLFLAHGHAYVYFIYGTWFALNVSAEPTGVGAGVLLRAIEPLEGIDLMRRRRGPVPATDLARGPGRLATALRIDRRFDGLDLCGRGPLWLGSIKRSATRIGKSVRIGITKETHRLLRFYERGNPHVSGPARLGV
jgi:DNA-3-methyladenine glycosylase